MALRCWKEKGLVEEAVGEVFFKESFFSCCARQFWAMLELAWITSRGGVPDGLCEALSTGGAPITKSLLSLGLSAAGVTVGMGTGVTVGTGVGVTVGAGVGVAAGTVAGGRLFAVLLAIGSGCSAGFKGVRESIRRLYFRGGERVGGSIRVRVGEEGGLACVGVWSSRLSNPSDSFLACR